MKSRLVFITFMAFIAVGCYGCDEDSVRGGDDQIPQFSGRLTGHTDCKGFLSAAVSGGAGDTSSCVEYWYDSAGHRLLIGHFNAGFNCCPESLYCLVSLRSDTIFIDERERLNGCHCLCLYDLDVEITGTLPKKYYVRLAEPYCGGQTKLNFEIDLSGSQHGIYCVKRTGYPWGE